MLSPASALELNRIFVTASLPEDHPHAITFPGRKPSFDDSIIRSPSFGNKLRRQLSRRSLAPGRSVRRLKSAGPLIIHRKRRTASDLPLTELFASGRPYDGGYDSDARTVRVTSPPITYSSGTADQEHAVHNFDWLAPCTPRY